MSSTTSLTQNPTDSATNLATYIDRLIQNVPEELRARRQWVVWKLEQRAGDDKPTKVPYNAQTGRKAKADTPNTWSGFELAAKVYGNGKYNGLGFVFAADDPYTGIDFDACIADGAIAPETLELVHTLASYTERSQSGKGVHVIVRAAMPEGKGRKSQRGEMYDRLRFFAFTGDVVEGMPAAVEERQAQIPAVMAALFPVKAQKAVQARSEAQATPSNATDDELWEMMLRSHSGDAIRNLYAGDTSDHGGGASAADLALCNYLAFWTGRDAGRMDRMFRQSALMRDKWERNARAGETYGAGTIARAIEDCHEVYTGKRTVLSNSNGSTQEEAPPPNGTQPLQRAAWNAGDARCTDLGNARRLVQMHGQDMRYCYLWKAWIVWDGMRWARDNSGQVYRWAKHTVTRIYGEAQNALDEERKELAKWAIKSESRDRISAMIELAQSEPGIAIQPEDLDTDAMLLNATNGTLNLRTLELQPHRREDYITKLTPIFYDELAQAPTWDSFLWRIMAGNIELINFLQRTVGYALTGDVSEQCLFYLYGKGANGKSTFLTTILAMLSRDYATQAAPELLTAGDRHPTEIADLRGLRFVASTEIEDGRRMAEGLVKQMTGGDVLKARFMRADFFQFEPTHKLFLAANHKLIIRGTDHAMWRRIRLIPFTVTIPDAEKDLKLVEKLRAELPGILRWAVSGCADWLGQGLNPPAEVTGATAEYRNEMDVLGRYLEERLMYGEFLTTQAADLYADYCAWCKDNGEKELSQIRFGRDLVDRGLNKATNPSNRRTYYQGVGLLHSGDADNPM